MLFFNLNESRLIIEEDLLDRLLKIDSPVASWLLRLMNSQTDIDKLKKNNINVLEDSDDKVSFIPDGKTESSKSTIKIGRFIRDIAILTGKTFDDSTIEVFVNKYKASFKSSINFRILKGDDILSSYKSENYYSDKGTLGNSCMNDELDSVSFYAENPDVCSVLVLYDDTKILGRSLLWVTTEDKKLMDRIYTARDSDVETFRQWALDNGYYYKTKNNSMIGSSFKGKDDSIHEVIEIKIANELSPDNIYPYLDTFAWGYGNILTNSEPEDESVSEYYSLRSTNGQLEVHSAQVDYLGDTIPHDELDDYVMSKTEGGLIPRSESLHLKYSYSDITVDDYVLDNSSYVYYCDIDDQDYLLKDCVWSDYENKYIFRGSAIYIMKDYVHQSHMDEFYKANPDIKNPYKVLEKSVSKSQQRLFGWAYACKKGYIDRCPRSIRKLGQSVKDKDLKDFAKTKHKDLPERVNKEKKSK